MREVTVIDRDTKKPEISCLAGSRYVALQADAEGWLRSDILKVRLTRTGGDRLVIEDTVDRTSRVEI